MVNCASGHEGRVALVTGAGRGIGKVIAAHLAAEGARVAVNSLTPAKAQDTASAIREAGGEVLAVPGDVSQPDDVETIVQTIRGEWGGIDILVNNAAVDRRGLILELAVADWDEVFAVNVRAPFLCLQAAARDMARRASGRIINIGSWVGTRPYVRSAPYCSSKAALLHLTRVAALELAGSGITVNAVCPGSTATAQKPMDAPALERRVKGDPAEFRAPIPAGRTAVPEDIASLVCYLATPAAHHVTGQIICVAGGQDLV